MSTAAGDGESPRRVAVLGASGFVGRHVVLALESRGAEVVRLPSVRVEGEGDAESLASAFARTDLFRTLVSRLSGCVSVVNAAGLALPGSSDEQALSRANTAVPIALFLSAREAGVPRFVHVSSAAVQGRRDPLDESPEVEPLTPYGRSKARAEQALSRLAGSAGPALIIYRATSVQGPGRGMTKLLARLGALPLLPVAREADRPLPLALAENCGAAIAHLALDPRASAGVYLHPWEGVTIRTFLSALGARPVPIPLLGAAARAAVRAGALFTARSPRLLALSRNAELFFLGQGQKAERLAAIGFSAPVGVEGYRDLASSSEARTARSSRAVS